MINTDPGIAILLREQRAQEDASFGMPPSCRDSDYLEAYHRRLSFLEGERIGDIEVDFVPIVNMHLEEPLTASHFHRAEWHASRRGT